MNINYYLNLSYTYIIKEEGDAYLIEVKELKGCISCGETLSEAWEMIKDAMVNWIEVNLEKGNSIPLPIEEKGYSGKLLLRTSKTNHKDLFIIAQKEKISLNALINTILSRYIGIYNKKQKGN